MPTGERLVERNRLLMGDLRHRTHSVLLSTSQPLPEHFFQNKKLY